ncbi:MAG: hypothetical protein DBY45_10100 [Clostridiales bacterium]|nr:MAG: hypothetical protein DBY45_10100 [Clostridiales bacterium]
MNNEEKILGILVQLQNDMSEMREEQRSMREDISSLHDEQRSMREELTKVAVTQENVVIPNIQLLAEGQITIQDQIKNLSVIDRLQDDVATLKTAVRFLSQKVEQLEKAM